MDSRVSRVFTISKIRAFPWTTREFEFNDIVNGFFDGFACVGASLTSLTRCKLSQSPWNKLWLSNETNGAPGTFRSTYVKIVFVLTKIMLPWRQHKIYQVMCSKILASSKKRGSQWRKKKTTGNGIFYFLEMTQLTNTMLQIRL